MTIANVSVDCCVGEQVFTTIKELYPLNRSITGEGLRDSLTMLQRIIPLEVQEVPSGSRVFDWTVPNEWQVNEAYIADLQGNRVVDVANHTLHLMGYSTSFSARLPLEQLQKHLYSLPEQPDAIPYVTSYYESRWGFCVSQKQRNALRDQEYFVHIDTELAPGSMSIADYVLPGESKQEILFSSYLCHPSMANNELSGPVLMAYLARELSQWTRRRFTYRFIFVPETIGAIAYLARHLAHLKTYVVGGLVVTCVGDPGPFSYLSTRQGNSLTDRVVQHVLAHSEKEVRQYNWLERGSDERQYNWPGIDLPIGSLMRTKYGEYEEYHTSLDDLQFISTEALNETWEMYLRCVHAFEENRCYRTTTLCEPQLGKRGLYPTLATRKAGRTTRDLVNLLAYCDGEQDLVQVADTIGVPIWTLSEWIPRLLHEELLVEQR